jgi:uncharacterized protein
MLRIPSPRSQDEAVENCEELVRGLFAAVGTRDLDHLGKMVAEDVRFEAPYAGDGISVVGREALVDMFGSTLGGFVDRLHLEITALYPGLNSDVLVAEYQSKATVLSTGRPYENRYIGVFERRNGLLALWREYFNPEILAAALAP